MKKDKQDKSQIRRAQKEKEVKTHFPIKNAVTNSAKNTATQTPGLNQTKTTRDDLFPSDGDNLTQ